MSANALAAAFESTPEPEVVVESAQPAPDQAPAVGIAEPAPDQAPVAAQTHQAPAAEPQKPPISEQSASHKPKAATGRSSTRSSPKRKSPKKTCKSEWWEPAAAAAEKLQEAAAGACGSATSLAPDSRCTSATSFYSVREPPASARDGDDKLDIRRSPGSATSAAPALDAEVRQAPSRDS